MLFLRIKNLIKKHFKNYPFNKKIIKLIINQAVYLKRRELERTVQKKQLSFKEILNLIDKEKSDDYFMTLLKNAYETRKK